MANYSMLELSKRFKEYLPLEGNVMIGDNGIAFNKEVSLENGIKVNTIGTNGADAISFNGGIKVDEIGCNDANATLTFADCETYALILDGNFASETDVFVYCKDANLVFNKNVISHTEQMNFFEPIKSSKIECVNYSLF